MTIDKSSFWKMICMLLLCIVITSNSLASGKITSKKIASDIFQKNKSITAEQWYSAEDSRAYFTLLTAIEVIKDMHYIQDDLIDYVSNPSWVGISKSKEQITSIGYIIAPSSTTILIATLTPRTSKIEYQKKDVEESDSEIIASMMEEIVCDIFDSEEAEYEYCQNVSNEMMSAYKTLYD